MRLKLPCVLCALSLICPSTVLNSLNKPTFLTSEFSVFHLLCHICIYI